MEHKTITTVCCFVILFNLTLLAKSETSVNRSEFEFQPFREFGARLNPFSNWDEDEWKYFVTDQKGTYFIAPFGIGHLLSNVRELPYNISSTIPSIDSFLKISHMDPNKRKSYYTELKDVFKTKNVTSSNALFSSDPRLSTIGKAIDADVTEVEFADFSQPWADPMRLRLSKEANGSLTEFVPRGGFLNNAFPRFVSGVLLNTIHYKTSLKDKWVEVPPRIFQTKKNYKFYERVGRFRYLKTDNYQAIALPLEDGNQLVFALPSIPFTPFLKNHSKEFLDGSVSLQKWESKYLKVEIPNIKLELMDQHYRYLKREGLDDQIMCNGIPDISQDPDQLKAEIEQNLHFLGPVVQGFSFTLSQENVEIAVATGFTVNSIDKLINGSPNQESIEEDVKTAKETETPAPTEAEPNILNDENKRKEKQALFWPFYTTVSFAKPFFWYLEDKELGPLSFGSVDTVVYKTEDGRGTFIPSTWIAQVVRNFLWNCPQIK